MPHVSLVFTLALAQASPIAGPEARIVEYLKANVRPGQRVVVSELYNNVFSAPEERVALNRLFNSFFKIPLFAAQYQTASRQPPTLKELSEQFRFTIPGQADVMLRIMESDPRVPKFLTRNAESGEIEKVDVDAILKSPRFGKALERSIAGFEGKPASSFTLAAYDGSPVSTEKFAGTAHLVYFWFSNCPPCVKTAPLLVELDDQYRGKGFKILGVNADRVLEVGASDEDRAAYAKKSQIVFTLAHMTAEMQEAYGQVSVFPTLFFVDKQGTIVKHLVNFHEKAVLEAAIELALQ